MSRIMLVEDEEAIAQTLLYALETEGFTTTWVRLGHEALASFAAQDIRLMILDVGLPDINGFELCREIRRHSEVPILFLTARHGEIDRVLGLELGGDDYVTKPFSPREVVARVRRILKRSEPKAQQEPLPASSLEVSVAHGRAVYHGVQLRLTRYELLLLSVLHSQPGRIFSRGVLMDAVWTDALDTDERTVDTHIKTLRAKLREIKPELDPIQTHRGLGYSLQLGS
ncbi:MAG TPA: two-component system response regulator CreB [Oligoflexus sp.]|uniref:two-component system response regulator CreB n=1 Tax=Oligoflexus sp. TaxID=1971216 RepID=UPI002D2CD027|nr:two-component system response regulator CreB [Oligoflexus sp.]HYX38118.1 two-component system response regulator CreB [Oligoflexus sp.]